MADHVASLRGRRIIASSLVTLMLGISVVVVPPATPAQAQGGCAVCENDLPAGDVEGEEGAFVGSAALVSPGGEVFDSGAGSSCPDCRWRTEPTCGLGGQATCGQVATCIDQETGERTNRLHTVFVLRPGQEDWTDLGDVCLGDGEDMLSTAELGELVREDWIHHVPEATPTAQPSDGTTLVNLPTYFHSGQPQAMPTTRIPMLGFAITLTARGEWTWTFEPGVTKTFRTPGSRYDDPGDKPVQHTYRSAGAHVVELTTNWWGTFHVGGYGPYDIETPATQGPYRLALTVTEGRGVLVE